MGHRTGSRTNDAGRPNRCLNRRLGSVAHERTTRRATTPVRPLGRIAGLDCGQAQPQSGTRSRRSTSSRTESGTGIAKRSEHLYYTYSACSRPLYGHFPVPSTGVPRTMCRSIKPLFNYAPPASDDDVRAASLQFVRKLSGMQRPSAVNQAVFDHAVDEIAAAASRLLAGLQTSAPPKNRELEAARARARSAARFRDPHSAAEAV